MNGTLLVGSVYILYADVLYSIYTLTYYIKIYIEHKIFSINSETCYFLNDVRPDDAL